MCIIYKTPLKIGFLTPCKTSPGPFLLEAQVGPPSLYRRGLPSPTTQMLQQSFPFDVNTPILLGSISCFQAFSIGAYPAPNPGPHSFGEKRMGEETRRGFHPTDTRYLAVPLKKQRQPVFVQRTIIIGRSYATHRNMAIL